MGEEDGQFRVIGADAVTVLDASEMRYNNDTAVEDLEPMALEGVLLTIVPPGYKFDLEARQLVHDNGQREHDKPRKPVAQGKPRGK